MIHHIAGPAGRLEALLDDPAARCTTGKPSTPGGEIPPPRAVVVLAHPHPVHGGTMHSKVVFQTAKAFCRLGCAVLRFNFRGAGTSDGEFAGGAGEQEDYRAALDFAASRFPGVQVWAVGASFGSWVAMTVGAADPRVTLLVGLATPAKLYDFSVVASSGKPKVFVHGEHDTVAPARAVWELYASAAEPKEIAIIDAADHLFDGRLAEMAEAVEGLVG
jgi:alpha/beta superfamily hydrolase